MCVSHNTCFSFHIFRLAGYDTESENVLLLFLGGVITGGWAKLWRARHS